MLIGRQGVHSRSEVAISKQFPRSVCFVRRQRGRRWVLDTAFAARCNAL